MKLLPVLSAALITFSPSAYYDNSRFCDQVLSVDSVVNFIMDECDHGSLSYDELASKILIEDDSDGPGYKDLFISYDREMIGSQIAFEKAQGCWQESLRELNCPKAMN